MHLNIRRPNQILVSLINSCFENSRGFSQRVVFPFIHGLQRSSVFVNTATTIKRERTNFIGKELSKIQSSDDYTQTVFADRATITVFAGSGGHGCISFLREKYVIDGPPNGGDGGTGGSIFIQAVQGETSLHKLARRNILRAGRGRNGKGKSRGGERGEDIVIKVPVGTVVREIERFDPISFRGKNDGLHSHHHKFENDYDNPIPSYEDRGNWILHPSIKSRDISSIDFPRFPHGRRSSLAAMQAAAPVSLDLKEPMNMPLLIVAGAIGGLGNPHFVTQSVSKPKYATKGEMGTRLTLELELKLLADVGLVGKPNAGKSTVLRAISRSRTRVGNWAFTTLQPNIGTVVLDDNKGRPTFQAIFKDGRSRTSFTVADIPGLVRDAHLDRGLGMNFLRHVERASVLAFVIDLSASDAIVTLKALWKEVRMYELMRISEINERAEAEAHSNSSTSPDNLLANHKKSIVLQSTPSFKNPLKQEKISVSHKPWFVVANKADLPGTEDNYMRLRDYLRKVNENLEENPSQQKKVWAKEIVALPVSAINNQGTEKIIKYMAHLLDD